MKYKAWENLAGKYNTLWVQKYSLTPTRKKVMDILENTIDEKRTYNILDIGCGTGQLSKQITDRFPNVSCLGIDVAVNMLDIAKNYNKAAKFKHAGIEDFRTTTQFDIIISTHAFPYFPDQQASIQKINELSTGNPNIILAFGSATTLFDKLIYFFVKFTTSKASYPSISNMKKMIEQSDLSCNCVSFIKERKYMPTIAVFEIRK